LRAAQARLDATDCPCGVVCKGKKEGGAVTVTFTAEQRGAAQGWYVEKEKGSTQTVVD
jgi:hypothetical protein